MKKPLKFFRPKRDSKKLHGGLFTESCILVPVKIDGETYFFKKINFKYKLNLKPFKKLLKLLKSRNNLKNEYNNYWDRTTKFPNNAKVPSWEKKLLELEQKQRAIFEKLINKFQYEKLVSLPNKPGQVIPYFDLRYVLQIKDLKQWAKVVNFELAYRYIASNSSNRGQPAKLTTYYTEVFEAYEKHFTDAKKNSNKPELIGGGQKATAWAAEKTIAEFPTLKINANTLIKKINSWRKKKA